MTRPSALPLLVWLLAAGMVATIVHLSSVFLLPRVATNDSFARLAPIAAGNGFHLLSEEGRRSAGLPFFDPGVEISVCRFDLETNPWRIRVDIDNEALTSLSFYTRNGTVFHTLTDRAALRGRLEVLLGTAAQIDAAEAADVDDAPSREVRLISPSATGTIIVRAMPASSSALEALRRRLNAAECRPAG